MLGLCTSSKLDLDSCLRILAFVFLSPFDGVDGGLNWFKPETNLLKTRIWSGITNLSSGYCVKSYQIWARRTNSTGCLRYIVKVAILRKTCQLTKWC